MLIGLAVISSSWAGVTGAEAQAAIGSESGWEDVGTTSRGGIDDISGRHKKLDGVDCLEASAPTDLSPELLKAIILDIESNLQWSSADLAASTVLSRQGRQQDYMQVLNLPAPFSDRYWFLRGTESESGGVWMFSWERIDADVTWPEARAALLADNSEAVEIGINVGSWALIEGSGGLTARFRSCTDVGGSVPRWAGEKAARLMLPNNIVDLLVEGQRQAQ
ncbi:MAG: hypothetical protein ACI8RZ_001232 [Myxococcota bacterium]|jgi:hypothetical protein